MNGMSAGGAVGLRRRSSRGWAFRPVGGGSTWGAAPERCARPSRRDAEQHLGTITAMLGIHDFGIFLATGVLLNLTPGQDTLYIVGRSLSQGRSAGIVSALGISTGSLIHTFAAALGLSAILTTSASAFMLVKFIGAGYLIYLGVCMLVSRDSVSDIDGKSAHVSRLVAYRQGILTNITNPKVTLFFLAFLPQFIDSNSPQKIAAFLALGFTFPVTGTLWCLVLAVSAARLRDILAARSGAQKLLNRATGAMFIALGLRLAAGKS